MISDDFLFTDIGIDSVSFHAPRHFVDIEELAVKRNVDPNKYKKGLLLKEMRLPEVDEDIISMGLKAGYNALRRGGISPKEIDAVFVGTETITYAVKSVSNIFAEMLDIPANSLTQDIYNACAGGTLAILNAIGLIEKGVINKALIISADISSYKLGSPSEATQGSGAIAFIISKHPRVATFSKKFGKVSGNVNDFFRPPNEVNAKVFGHYSVDTYLNFQLEAYDDLIKSIGDFSADYYTFHAPYSKLPLKCMQHIIMKRWVNHINNLPKIDRNDLKSSLLKKIDYFLHDVTVLPEYIYLKLQEKGFSSGRLEKWAHWVNLNVKEKLFPQLRVPMHFGNMYNAAVWSQILYILENYAHMNDTIYFGSYGSGATCISGLLKVKPDFKKVIKHGPKINDYIKYKEKKSVQEYELIKKGDYVNKALLGYICEHELNEHRGFTLHFCDEGCIIPNIDGLNHCPKGHTGFYERFFPLYAKLDSKPMVCPNITDLRYLKKGLVRLAWNVQKGNSLEYEIRRVSDKKQKDYNAVGLLNWVPLYIPVHKIY
ncbi:MAG: hydroxymethylglutaryl-CoA synthase family protein [Promethearchaeota archaeon]|nr:MAG: hydroxymethylglutaryl-CoA synthase family protein [Candidatus Lokiarchaeota archaeon]